MAEAIYPNFNVMIVKVRRNKLREFYYDLFFSSVKIGSNTKLIDLTVEQAELLGGAFVSSLQGNTLTSTAVDEWVNANEQLKELEVGCPWFRPLMNEMAIELLSTSNWGLIFRVVSSVAVGWADLGTDFSTIYMYFTTGQTGDGWALLTMCGLNMLIQLAMVYMQNTKNSKLIVARECFLVVTNMKPAADGYRAIKGIESTGPIDPLSEMTFTKISEVAFEALPGGVYQTKVFLKSGEKDRLRRCEYIDVDVLCSLWRIYYVLR